jgi:glutamine cyclotransferase
MSKNSGKKNKKKQKPSRKRPTVMIGIALVAGSLVLGLAGLMLWRSGVDSHPDQTSGDQTAAGKSHVVARRVAYEVVNNYPHDPAAFLQGLVWYDNGFYESTGQFGQSSLRRVEFPSGKVLQRTNLESQLFGEGLALVGNRLIQLTWQSHRGFVYDRETFKLLREFKYDTEGWGLTYDGKSLIMSDGSDRLTYLSPETFEVTRLLPVKFNGRPLSEINELEFIDAEIWANVWHSDKIVRIDPASGQVKSYLDLTGILPAAEINNSEAVLNGIAYDARRKRIFVSGKLWPRIFEIRLK